MSIPGIGWIAASQLLARIGDWRQIDNVRQLGSFLGLVPTENSTDGTVDRGSITRAGDRRLRSKLIQAAWSAIRQDPELREFYRSVCRRNGPGKGPRIAIVAVARKLSMRVYAVLKNQRAYVVREQVHSTPLTQEETSPRERLAVAQNREKLTTPEGSRFETESQERCALERARCKKV